MECGRLAAAFEVVAPAQLLTEREAYAALKK
jgi:hypothetical protein